MVYTNKEDKEQIRKAFNMLLAEFGTNLKRFCSEFGYSYPKTYQQITGVNQCSHELINEMVAKLDPKRSLQRVNKRLVISRTF